MTPQRVRPMPEFFQALDQQLPDERGPHGEPSRYDFLSIELPETMEAFATSWDQLPQQIAGRADYRTLVRPGRLVAVYSVEAQLSPSGVIELVDLALDLAWPDGSTADEA